MTREDFIEKARNVHGDKYDYSLVEYKNNYTPVTIICKTCGKSFEQIPSNHFYQKQCCPFCRKSLMKTTEEFINDARKVHGDKYDYSKVEYKGNKEKICIICHEKDEEGKEHGEFIQQALTHLRGYGCPKCSCNYRMTREEFIEKARKVHGDKYDYSKSDYKGSHKKVCIICPEHGEFWQLAKNHLRGYDCPKCKGKNKTNDDFLYKAKKIHGDNYDYSKTIYKNVRSAVCITCKTHGDFWQTPHVHLEGHGCPKCGNISSVYETEIADYIRGMGEIVKERDKEVLKPREIDIFLPLKNIAFEYDGLIWHSEKFGKNKNYHLKKTIECQNKGIKLIHIFEDEYLEHKEIVLNKLSHILGNDVYKKKIYARKCTVSEIKSDMAKSFLDKNHIQGFVPSTVYIGCFSQNELVGVMSFKREINGDDKWELNRFASKIEYNCCGIGGKLFSYFIKKYNPSKIKSFADRRWTLDEKDNLYTKIGFKLTKILSPDYQYVVRNKRIHKFNMRKKRLLKQYNDSGLTSDMTEKEMCDKLGFYRIWDCGLLKYEWFNKN